MSKFILFSIIILCLVVYYIYMSYSKDKFTNKDLALEILKGGENFSNKDQFTLEESEIDVNHVVEQKLYHLLKTDEQKKYLNSPEYTKVDLVNQLLNNVKINYTAN